VRWSPDGAFEQVSNPVLQNAINRQADRIPRAFGFEVLVYLGIGEGCVAPEIQTLYDAPVTSNHRLQHRAPTIGYACCPLQRAPVGHRRTGWNTDSGS
jgi:predicted ATPase